MVDFLRGRGAKLGHNPIGMGTGQVKLELEDAVGVAPRNADTAVLQAVQSVGDVRTPDVHLVGGHTDDGVLVEEKVMQHVEDGRLRVD